MLFLRFVLAVLPILWLVIALSVLKIAGHKACVAALLLTAVLAVFYWKLSVVNTLTAGLEGVLNALWPICLVIVAALFTYNLTLETGAMEAIKKMLAGVSVDERVLLLIIGWGFGNFMEGMAGFGTAVAIPASMLVGIGLDPMRAVKYGATRDYVRAMTVVLPTGEITHLGATVSKTSSGYSLLNLMIGSEGTLGIITELTLKIIPAPKVVASLIIPFEDLDTALSTVPKFKMAHMDPQAIEFMEREIVLSSERYIGKSVFPQELEGTQIGAYLLVTLDGKSEDEVDALIEEAAELVLEAGAMDVLVADTPGKIKDAWAARSSFLEAIMEETKLLDECDVVVPVNKIAEYLAFVNKTGEECGLEIKSFGHAGDGNLHIYQCSNDLEEEEFKKRVDKFFDIIYKEATNCGGLVSGEHGIGSGKVKYLVESVGETNMALMEGIKRVFDPKMILNPGKVCYRL